MSDDEGYAWRVFRELRAETLEAQRIRAQIIQVKITTVGVGIGIILSVPNPAYQLLALPAFAAMFFDFLVNSYSVSIKRIGLYTREILEPQITKQFHWPPHLPTWEKFMSSPIAMQHYSDVGNLGLTLIASGVGIIGLFNPFGAAISLPTTAVLIALLGFDLLAFLKPRRMFMGWHPQFGVDES